MAQTLSSLLPFLVFFHILLTQAQHIALRGSMPLLNDILAIRQDETCPHATETVCPDGSGCCASGAACTTTTAGIGICEQDCGLGPTCTGALDGLCCQLGEDCDYIQNMCTPASTVVPTLSSLAPIATTALTATYPAASATPSATSASSTSSFAFSESIMTSLSSVSSSAEAATIVASQTSTTIVVTRTAQSSAVTTLVASSSAALGPEIRLNTKAMLGLAIGLIFNEW